MRTRSFLITASGAALLLSGCAAGLQDAGDDSAARGTSASSGTSSNSTDDSGTPTSSAPTESAGSSSTPSGDVLVITLPADIEQDCAGRNVEVTGTGDGDDDRDVELKGQCGSVTISAAGGDVEIDTAESVVVSGSSNRIEVETVGSIEASGSNNDIEYDRGTSGPDPTVTDSGSGNRVHRDDSPGDD